MAQPPSRRSDPGIENPVADVSRHNFCEYFPFSGVYPGKERYIFIFTGTGIDP
jgi:hypothetical protein